MNSFIEVYLVCSWILWLVTWILTIVLSIFFPPHFIIALLTKYSNSIWVYIVYGLVAAVIIFAFYVGFYFAVDYLGTLFINLRGRAIDKKLAEWANSRVKFKFKTLPAAISISYGAWQWSLVQADNEFYNAVRSSLSSIISQGADTTETAYGLASQNYFVSLKNKNKSLLLIACYILTSLYIRGLEKTKDVLSMQ